MIQTVEIGYFGNIWVRQNLLEKSGDSHEGHKHKFDHVTLLTSGKMQVEIEGHGAKEFTAPTFVIIRKDYHHKITALDDQTVYYCIFALRDLNGEVVDEMYGSAHDPLVGSADKIES